MNRNRAKKHFPDASKICSLIGVLVAIRYAIIGRKKKIEGSHQSLEYIYKTYNDTRQFHHWKEFAIIMSCI